MYCTIEFVEFVGVWACRVVRVSCKWVRSGSSPDAEKERKQEIE